jgi:uncharacterized NAD(P)/FAD-binding protein YdhS
MRTVAIVGGGFSGAVTAINLARLSRTPLQVVVINKGYPLARGVAYSTRRPEHLLNVVARNMSALADQPGHLVEWLRTRHEYADLPEAALREQFIPRRIYGDYLQSLFFWHTKAADTRSLGGIEALAGAVVDIALTDGAATVALDGDRRVVADKVVLATGNNAPVELKLIGPACAGFVDNPWLPWSCEGQNQGGNALLVGSGLTMIDAYLTLTEQGWKGKIYSISRNGLIPHSHFKGIEYPEFPPEDVATYSLEKLAALMEQHCASLRKAGNNPAIVVDKLRPFTQRIWDHFTAQEKQEFSRRYRSVWGVYRHRIAESVHHQLTDGIERRNLHILKGRVRAVRAAGERMTVDYENVASQKAETLDAALVINCTGPRESYAGGHSALFANLLDKGLVQADELDMGIRVDRDFTVLDSAAHRSACLYAIGPLLKGTLWETTAVPELRLQAFQIAENILSEFEGVRLSTLPAMEAYADVLEYCI